MAITGMPASIIFLIGSISVPMPKVWIATKSQVWVAMLSIAARCLVADSSPSNQVISTFISLPQASAACLPCAHQVACRPALEKAAFSGLLGRLQVLRDRRIEAGAGEQSAAPSAVAPMALKTSRRLAPSRPISSSASCAVPGFSPNGSVPMISSL